MQRQDLIAQQAKSKANGEVVEIEKQQPDNSHDNNGHGQGFGRLENKFLNRKVRQPLNRKPLYPTTATASSSKSKKKAKESSSAKSTVTIKGNFVRAARLDNHEVSEPSANDSPERSRTASPNDQEEDYYSEEEYSSEEEESEGSQASSYRRSLSASPTSRRSPSASPTSRRSPSASPSRRSYVVSPGRS